MINREVLSSCCDDILKYLVTQSKQGEYPARCFYGELFTALSMALFNKDKYINHINEYLNYYDVKDKTQSNFHWEFNNYALINISKNINERKRLLTYLPLKFKGTKCTNWTMLRGLSRLLLNKNSLLGHYEVLNKIKNYQDKTGLIKDNKDVNSFQYHCFSTALIAEIYEVTKLNIYRESFLKAVDFIKKFILPNGCTNYIGRGQEQIFGYGPLIYILEVAYQLTDNLEYKKLQEIVYKYLLRFRRSDGSFPLVLNKKEKGYPPTINLEDRNYLGWYGYNNYFDYLPFFCYYLVKTLNIYKEVEANGIDQQSCIQKSYVTDDYVVHRNYKYTAVIASGGGYWTNDMPIPLICINDSIITPCYGGEQYGSQLYSQEGIPLPWGICEYRELPINEKLKNYLKRKLNRNISNKYFFRDHLQYTLFKKQTDLYVLIGESFNITHRREFRMLESEIKIYDEIIFKTKMQFNVLHLVNLLGFEIIEENHNSFIERLENIDIKYRIYDDNNRAYIDEKKYFCAFGSLDNIKTKEVNISFKPRDVISSSYSISF